MRSAAACSSTAPASGAPSRRTPSLALSCPPAPTLTSRCRLLYPARRSLSTSFAAVEPAARVPGFSLELFASFAEAVALFVMLRTVVWYASDALLSLGVLGR
jgi:hypothetical protein